MCKFCLLMNINNWLLSSNVSKNISILFLNISNIFIYIF